MIKHLRKLISITLIIAIFTQTLPAYAASFDSTSSALNNPSISIINISMIANAIMGDPAATDIQISENVLTYKMNGTTNVRIAQIIKNNVYYFDITEGEIHDIVSINVPKNIITLNGTPLTLEISQYISRIPNENKMATFSTNWIYSSTRDISIVAEDAIRNLAVNTLFTLMLAAMGGIGVAIGLAQVIWNSYKDLTSDTVYASRATYFEENYWAYKYVDRYYSNSARVGTPIDTVTTECWP